VTSAVICFSDVRRKEKAVPGPVPRWYTRLDLNTLRDSAMSGRVACLNPPPDDDRSDGAGVEVVWRALGA
jgi:hypothetical protein